MPDSRDAAAAPSPPNTLGLEDVLEAFEAAWQGKAAPRLEDYLPGEGDERRAALVELVHVDLENRLKAGEAARVEEYLARFPELAADVPVVAGLIRAEYEQRRRREPGLRLEDFQARFPDHLAAGATLHDVASGLAVPRIPGFEVVGHLGSGGMGVVYKARQVKLKRFVALKVIPAGPRAGPEQLARFRREAESVARLQHPHIVQIHEVGEHEGAPYLALEFVEGGSLHQKVSGKPQPPGEAAALVEVLARATHYAHERGVVHRDLKPANILLTAGGTPKVADFSLAKCLDDDAGQTRTGAILGTPSYMAPEQAAGGTMPVGPAADVYALGAILYECLTGRPPFLAATVLETLEQVRGQEPVSPRHLQPKVPRDLDTVCLKCLRKEPARRYAGALALAEDLRRFGDGLPILARPPHAAERAWRWCRRRPVVAGLLALLVVVVAGSLAGLTSLYLHAEEQRRQAVAARQAADAEAEKARRSAEAQAEARRAVGQMVGVVVGVFRASDPVGLERFTFFTPAGADELPALRLFLDRAAREVLEKLHHDPVARAEVLDTLGHQFRTLGDFGRAGPMLEEAVTLRREHLGKDHPDYATSLHNLAWLYHDQGRYANAEPLYEEALAIRRAQGEDDPAYEATRLNQAWVYTLMGRYKEAEAVLLDLLARRTRRLGETDREVAIVKAALTALYLDSGEAWKASRFAVEAAQVFAKSDGDKRIMAAVMSFQEGAMAFHFTRDYPTAEKKLSESAKLWESIVGKNHMYMAGILHELARARDSKGDPVAAEATYREFLTIARKTVGLSHPKLAVGVTNFGLLLNRVGKAAEADALFAELLAAHRERFGHDHPLVADAMVEFSAVYLGRRDDEAERWLSAALAIYRKAEGTRHRLLADCLNSLGVTHFRRRNYAEAERLLTEALALARPQFGEGHLTCALFRTNLAAARLRQGKTDGVEELLEDALKTADVRVPPVIGAKPDLLHGVLGQMGLLARMTGRPVRAEEAARKRLAEAGGDANRLYDTARDFALLTSSALGESQERREGCAAQAIKALRRISSDKARALAALLVAERDFDALRGRDDFRRLLDDLQPPEPLPLPAVAP